MLDPAKRVAPFGEAGGEIARHPALEELVAQLLHPEDDGVRREPVRL